jgi:ADP-dependent NAD(P)H-hydrate dehydratase
MCLLLHVDVLEVVPPLLRDLPLPAVGSSADKNARGQVLVVGGSRETPGGVLLAGVAALRVGAGRLQLATAGSVAVALALAVPEARVIGLPENDAGAVSASSASALVIEANGADAILIGTGALDGDETGRLLCELLCVVGETTTVIIDAAGLGILAQEPALLRRVAERTIVMPNPREMAGLLGCDVGAVDSDPVAALDEAVRHLGVVVTLRGAETWTSAPGAPHYRDRSGHAALGTAGSGDVLAGALTGLSARGADPLRAALWSVHCHGIAGEVAAGRGPGVGLLARELLAELPYALRSLEA